MKLGKGRPKMTEGPPGPTIIALMWPMFIGMIALISYSLVDTWFVGRIGTLELAAVAFTFPVAFIINAISIGLGIGTSSVASRLFGAGEIDKIQRITTHSAMLALGIGLILLTIGLNTIEPVFRLLGADETTLPLIEQYMSIYYFGSVALIVPMIGNSVLRASGDAKTPSMLMTVGALLNVPLDYIFIFGFGPVPAMYLEGAAIATVIANALVGSVSFGIVYFRDHLIRWQNEDLPLIFDSWRRIFHVGIPAMASSLVAPLTTAFITWQVSQFGQEAVAGFGVAARIEGMSLMALMALSAAITPYAGQNYGAGQYQRVMDGMKYAYRWCIVYGLLVAVCLFLTSAYIGGLFTESETAISTVNMHLRLVPWSYCFLGISMVSVSAFNAVGKPKPAMLISMTRTILIYAPLAFILAALLGLPGVFLAAFLANIISGSLGFAWFRTVFLTYLDKEPETEAA
ncbi:MAG: MATE family efflux transporter [Gammaproteobacteria bacterium]|nr:MATE family efflux transporter [Gammaproteobacteria bacterium]